MSGFLVLLASLGIVLWIYVISWHNFDFLALESTSKLTPETQNSYFGATFGVTLCTPKMIYVWFLSTYGIIKYSFMDICNILA